MTDVCSTADPYIDPAVLAKKRNTSICAPATRLSADRGRDPGSYQWVATYFLYDWIRRISLVSGEDREPQFLFQRILITIRRINAVLLHDGFFLSPDHPD